MTRDGWRRTSFEDTAGNVEIAPDDWTLLDPSGGVLAGLAGLGYHLQLLGKKIRPDGAQAPQALQLSDENQS
jgi:hypothetical protein